eukprot:1155061-Pelagomonas_calceolata.AAC.3
MQKKTLQTGTRGLFHYGSVAVQPGPTLGAPAPPHKPMLSAPYNDSQRYTSDCCASPFCTLNCASPTKKLSLVQLGPAGKHSLCAAAAAAAAAAVFAFAGPPAAAHAPPALPLLGGWLCGGPARPHKQTA